MTELECPGIYENGESCGACAYCLALQVAALDGSPSDLDIP